MASERTATQRALRMVCLLFMILMVIAGLVVFRFVGCFVWTRTVGYSSTSFSARAWRWNWSCGCTPVRMQMAQDLATSTDMRGWSRDQVVSLLGAPDPDAYIQPFERPGDFVYYLAPSFIDNYWFVVRFDDSGRVSEAKVMED